MERIAQRATAEFFATLALVFIGAGSVILSQNVAGTLGVALAHGLVLAIMVTAIGHISGGHVNPAVTISAWVTNQIKTAAALVYIVSQLAGAAAGAVLLRVTLPELLWKGNAKHPLGVPFVETSVMSNGKAVLLEAILTFFLVFVVYAVAIDDRGAFSKIAGLPIGLVLTFDILVGGPLTGAAMNPARAFGPMVGAGEWSDWWVYWIGPVGGGVIAASVYWFAFLGGREKMARVPRSEKPIEGSDTPMPEETES